MKIKSNTTNKKIYLDVSVSIRGLRPLVPFLLTKASDRDRNVKVNLCWLCLI